MGKQWREFYASEYLRAEDLPANGATATIATVEGGELEGEDGRHSAAIVTFAETKTKWAVNNTNRICLEALFGDDSEAAIGKRVTLMQDTCEVRGQYFGKPAIRVKGSPELTGPLTVTIKLPKRKPFQRVLVPTGQNHTKSPENAPQALVTDTGEVV